MDVPIRESVPLAPLTTLGLGGPARYFAACADLEQVRACLQWAAARQLPVQVLGGGSNVLFADEGYAGLVLKLDLRGLEFDGAIATVAAGEVWDDFVERAIQRGLAGVECLSGIPGLAGATPIQNVGAYGQEVGETLLEVRALDRESLEEVRFAPSECGFAYRQSRFKGADRDRYIIAQVRYRLRADGRPQIRYPELERHLRQHHPQALRQSGPEALAAVRRAVLALRAGKSMLVDPADPHSRSAGSFFLNPVIPPAHFQRLRRRHPDLPSFAASGGVKVPAAWLVERAGFARGLRHGGVGISPKHALALVNYGGSARQLLELASRIQQRVWEEFAIALEREPVLVA